MSTLDVEMVVVVVRHDGRIRWFKSDRDLWVLDINKWRNEFISHGYEVPEFKEAYRFGIHVVSEGTARQFLDCMSKFEVSRDGLGMELARRFSSAGSWWDVKDLFPIMFVNFDERKVGAFYAEGTPMERYVADGWRGEFVDFSNEYTEDVFPAAEKFWIRGDSDLLAILNERGSKK